MAAVAPQTVIGCNGRRRKGLEPSQHLHETTGPQSPSALRIAFRAIKTCWKQERRTVVTQLRFAIRMTVERNSSMWWMGDTQYTVIDDCSRYQVIGVFRRKTATSTVTFLEQVV